MFLFALGTASALMWLALELYWHAQRAEARDSGLDQRITQSHHYLRSQLPRGIGVNARKTVVVDYEKGIDLGDSWEDDLSATQAVWNSHESGFRPKVKPR
jgi:hypothetical protein